MSIQTKQLKPSTIMWTAQSALKAFRTKRELTTEEVKQGARKLFTVKGNGTIMDVIDGSGNPVMSADGSGELLQKKIFNTDYLSPSGLKSPITKTYLSAALQAEKEGRTQDAADNFNAYLNAVTLSFSVLSNSKYFNGMIGNGDQIAGNIQSIEGVNGTLVTIDPKSISVKQVTVNEFTSMNPFEPITQNEITEEVIANLKTIPSEIVNDFLNSTQEELVTV